MAGVCTLGRLIFLLPFFAVSQGSDPCVTYKTIDNAFRSTSYVIKQGDPAICDKGLKVGWYRFVNAVGGTLPESKVEVNHCGTIAPIWMQGLHPSLADDVVDRVACVNYLGLLNGCLVAIQIKVKKCNDGFFVYYLQPPHGCPMGYCAGMLFICFRYELQQNRFKFTFFFRSIL